MVEAAQSRGKSTSGNEQPILRYIMINKTFFALLFMTTCMISFGAYADVGNDIPSCYAANKIEIAAPASQYEVFILIDETTVLDDNLQNALFSITQSLIKPGVKFSLLSFSAFVQGRYLSSKVSGVLELPLLNEVRSSVGVKVLKNFDACMAGQARYGLDLALKTEKSVLQTASSDLQKSDVIASIAEVSRLVKNSTIPKKIVLIVSDMLENSTVSSFYTNGNVRRIDPVKEMNIVAKEKMFGDFVGANIYVMGAGVVPEKGKTVYRDPITMQALKSFWQAYFQKSNAELAEFGQPALLNPIH